MGAARRSFAAVAVALGVVACGGNGATVPPPGTDPIDGAPGTGSGPEDAAASGALDGGGASDAGGSDAGSSDAGAWTPKQLPGLSLWLDDTVGVVVDPATPGRVARWLDQSGLDNTAEAGGGDGVTKMPALAPGVAGQNAIVCDRQTYLSVANAPSLQFGTGDFGIVVVGKAAPLASLFSKASALTLDVTAEATMRLRTTGAGGGLVVLAGTPTNTFSITVARGAALGLRVGAASSIGPVSTADVSAGTAPVVLCRGGLASYISLAEVIVVKGPLGDADLIKTTAYLKAKFGL